MIAELADGRRLEFPDGTDPAVVQATVKKMIGAPAPDTAVAVNAANKGIAGIPDALLNTPSNIINLGKAAYGMGAKAMGREDLMPFADTPNPNLASKAMRAMGFTSEENEPKNARQRIVDTMIQAGVGATVSPAKSVTQVVKNVAMGEAGGAAAGATKEATHNEALAISAGMLTPAAITKAVGTARPMTDVKAKTLEDAEAAGYGVPASEKIDSWANNRLESIAGKAAIKQELGNRNQTVTTAAAAKELGFPKGTAITEGLLDGYRDSVAKPYRDVSALSPTAASALEELTQARYDAKVYGRHADMTGDPTSVAKEKQARADVVQWEQVIDQEARRVGPTKLPDELKQAREQIAKSYDIERGLNLGSAEVSAPSLGRALDRGQKLSGGLETAAKFQQAFPNYATEGERIPTPGVSKSEAIASALLAAGGGAALGPIGMTLGAIPYASGPVRSMVLSKPYQDIMAPREPLSAQDSALRTLLITRAIAERKQR